jgi:hypothetical protein
MWMNTLVSVVFNNAETPDFMFKPFFEGGKMYFYKPGGSEKIYIEDYIPDRAPIHFRDEFILEPSEILNYQGTEPLRTTYGNVFFNQLCLVEPFGLLIPFVAGTVVPSKFEEFILERMIDDRPDGNETEMAPDGKLYVWQYLKFCDHCLAIPGYADGLVTSTTRKSLLSSPEWPEIRAKWIAENSHRLTDPAAVAELSVLADKVDAEHLKGDESLTFYTAKKKLAGARRKVHYMFGGESPFSDGTTVEFISKSLEEGIDTDHMEVMNNSLRFGSYNRGAQTALGGESTKTIYRMVGTARIIMDDCKTWLGIPSLVTEFNADGLVGYAYVDNGQSIEITKEMLPQLMGARINIRGPMTCKAGRDVEKGTIGKGKNICGVCAGKALAENPNGIPAATAGVGGRFLMVFMSKMHSSTLRTVKWDMRARLT